MCSDLASRGTPSLSRIVGSRRRASCCWASSLSSLNRRSINTSTNRPCRVFREMDHREILAAKEALGGGNIDSIPLANIYANAYSLSARALFVSEDASSKSLHAEIWQSAVTPLIIELGVAFICFCLSQAACPPEKLLLLQPEVLQRGEDAALQQMVEGISAHLAKPASLLKEHGARRKSARCVHFVTTRTLPVAMAHAVRDSAWISYPHLQEFLGLASSKTWLCAVFAFLYSGQRLEEIEGALKMAAYYEWPPPSRLTAQQLRGEDTAPSLFPALDRDAALMARVRARVEEAKEAARLLALPIAERNAEEAAKRADESKRTTALGVPLVNPNTYSGAPLTMSRGRQAFGKSPLAKLQSATAISEGDHHHNIFLTATPITSSQPRSRRYNYNPPPSNFEPPRIPVKLLSRSFPSKMEIGATITTAPAVSDCRALLMSLLPVTVEAELAKEAEKKRRGNDEPSPRLLRRMPSLFERIVDDSAVRRLGKPLTTALLGNATARRSKHVRKQLVNKSLAMVRAVRDDFDDSRKAEEARKIITKSSSNVRVDKVLRSDLSRRAVVEGLLERHKGTVLPKGQSFEAAMVHLPSNFPIRRESLARRI